MDDQVTTKATHVSGLYKNWYLDYASYVILERAIPHLLDGLKPVQRRILHAMKEMDDGRFNKVANIIGQSMQYHPHGDASIGDAIVKIGQKNLLIETQGNWGDVRTGDAAAASRYIEARLSAFALEVVFSPKITKWGLSYDGRKKEPLVLPAKFPLLLAQGAIGIAASFATTILPHNFIELIQAAIKHLKGKPFELYPDFETGGSIDVQQYQDGKRGGKIICRARIEEVDKKTLLIKDLPFGVTTSQLCDSIVSANEKGKIKIRKVTDNTAQHVEIQIELMAGIAADVTIQALYAFTDCQVNIYPNACVIYDDKPQFLGVSEILMHSVNLTKDLLKQELLLRLSELHEDWHHSSLEKIFIEYKIYTDIEEQSTWEGVLSAIHKGLEPFKKKLQRAITNEDVVQLTEIKIKRISKYDTKKADEHIKSLQQQITEIKQSIEQLTDFTITYYENLLKKYGKGRERKTEIKRLESIEAKDVAIANTKFFVNRKEGFVGTSLKNDELVGTCSDLDDIIVFRKDGVMLVTKISEKSFVGKDILHIDVFKKNDERTTYHLIYVDGKSGKSLAKRFHVQGITRDKEYILLTEDKLSKIHYFSVQPNAEEELVEITLSPHCKAQKKTFLFNFKTLDIKHRNVLGNQLTKYPIRHVKQKKLGSSTLGATPLWYHKEFGKLVSEEDATSTIYLGAFEPDETILIVYKQGTYEIVSQELTQRFEPTQVLFIQKYKPHEVLSLVYQDGEKKQLFVKRFRIETTTLKTKFWCIKEAPTNEIILATTKDKPQIVLQKDKKNKLSQQVLEVQKLVEVMGVKSIGVSLVQGAYAAIQLI